MNIGEHDWEPEPGLPERLPPGEHVLWQGAPRWTALARRGFHVRTLTIYFGALLALRVLWALADGLPVHAALAGAIWLLPFALACVGVLAGLAWLSARTTLYTVTNRRVVMRFGIALPVTLNLPFRAIESAALRTHAGGTGDIPLALAAGERIAYLHLWPHVRAWKLRQPEPMLRAVPDAARVAAILGQALAASAGTAPMRTVEPAAAHSAAPRPLVTVRLSEAAR